MVELNKYYHDRGMKKFSGFYISEHTTEIERISSERRRQNVAKPQMSSAEINELIGSARLNDTGVVIQLEAVDSEGNYFDDITGKLLGFDELGFYIGNQKVGYDEIRHIELDHSKKWSDLTDK